MNSSSHAEQILEEKLFSAIKRGLISEAEKYLFNGADPNYIVSSGHSSFHLASGCECSTESVRLILKYNGNPNVRNREGQTPLHIATSWGKLDCIKLLARSGADVHLKDNEGRNLMEFAMESGSAECMLVVKTLMRQGTHMNGTPSSSKKDQAIKHATMEKENRTFGQGSPVSLLSPLHHQCDVSWIAKDRGSGKRWRKGSGEKTAENNSSATCTPIFPLSSRRINTNKTPATDLLPYNTPVYLSSPRGLSSERCLSNRKPPFGTCYSVSQPPDAAVCQQLPETGKRECLSCSSSVRLDPYFTAQLRAISEKGCMGDEQPTHCGCRHVPVSQVGAWCCGGAFILTPVNRPPAQTRRCGNCGDESKKGVSSEFDVTDKCVATSLLGVSDLKKTPGVVTTDSVACQVTICKPPDEDFENETMCPKKNEMMLNTATPDAAGRNNMACQVTISKPPDKDSENEKICTKENETMLEKTTTSDTVGRNNIACQVTISKPCDKDSENENNCAKENEMMTEKAAVPDAVVRNNVACQVTICQPPDEALDDDKSNDRLCRGVTAERVDAACRIEASSSPSSVMKDFESKNKGPDVSSPDHCISSIHGTKSSTETELRRLPLESDSVESNFTFSDSTLPVRRDYKSICKSLSMPENHCAHPSMLKTNVRIEAFESSESALPVKSHYKSICVSPPTPDNHCAHPSISLRKFASAETTNSIVLESPVVPEREDLKKMPSWSSPTSGLSARSCVSLRRLAMTSNQTDERSPGGETATFSTDVAPKTADSRMHSTALSSTRRDILFSEDDSLDISIIKADGKEYLRLNVGDDAVFEETERQVVFSSRSGEPEAPQSSSLQLSQSPANASSQSTVIYNWKAFWKGEPIPESAAKKRRKKAVKSVVSSGDASQEDALEMKRKASIDPLDEPVNLSDAEIRDRLISLGHNPGPIAACRSMYVRRLKTLMTRAPAVTPSAASPPADVAASLTTSVQAPKFSAELLRFLTGVPPPGFVVDDDDTIRSEFEQPDPSKLWREGTTKDSFTYLLLDPRVTAKLPIRARLLSEEETFRSFVGGVFYVGKGKQSRPYSHFYEARQTDSQLYKLNPSRKVRHIHDIWREGHGVVSLHVFQSVVACEAYTREAAIIDAIGLSHLTNLKRGDYYGSAVTWSAPRRRTYGAYLLKRAMEVLMVEGERQIMPSNLRTRSTKQ